MNNINSNEYKQWLSSLEVGSQVMCLEIKQGVLDEGWLLPIELTVISINEKRIKLQDCDGFTYSFNLEGVCIDKGMKNCQALFPKNDLQPN